MANPNYSGGIPSVAPEAAPANDYQHIEANPADFGGQVAGAVSKVGQDTTQVADFFGQVQTDDAVNGAMTSANAAMNHFESLQSGDRLKAQDDTSAAIDDAFQAGRENLTSPRQQYQYDQNVRAFRERYINGKFQTLANEAAIQHSTKTVQDTTELSLQGIASVADDPDPSKFDMFRENLRNAMVKGVQIQGNGGDPDAVSAAVTKADQLAYTTQAETIAVKDPVRAQQLVESKKDVLGPHYAELSDKFRGQAQLQGGIALGNEALGRASAPVASDAQQGQAAPQGLAPPSPNSIGNVKTSYGARTGLPDFVQPATPVDGVVVAANDLRSNYRGLTLEQIGQKWVGDDKYPTWVSNVSKATGMAPNAVPNMDDQGQLSTLLGGIKVAEKSHSDQANFSPDVIQTGVTQAMTGKQANLNPSTLKANAYDHIMSSGADDITKQHAITYVNQQYQQSLIASDMDAQAKKQASDAAEGGWVDKILTNPTGLSTADIAKDQSLTPQSKILMSDLLAKHLKNTDDGTAAAYGRAFNSVLDRATAPQSDPNRLTDQNAVTRMALPGPDGQSDLTLAGVKEINGILEKNKTAEGIGESQQITGALTYMKHHLSFESDDGYTKRRDPAGEDLYNSAGLSTFFSAYKAAKSESKTGQVPPDFFSAKNYDAMIAPIKRTEAQVQRDMDLSNAGIDPSDPTAPRIPMKVQTQQDFDALPPGAQFINPADGRVMIKNKPAQAPAQ
jgi:hypothetical protein